MNVQKVKEKIQSFIERGELINKKERHIPERGLLVPEYIAGPMLNEWIDEISVYNERYLKTHPLYSSIKEICDNYKGSIRSCDKMISKLKVILSDEEFWSELYVELTEVKNDDKDKKELLSILRSICNSEEDVYLSENDERIAQIDKFGSLMEQLSRDGFIRFKKDTLGNYYDIIIYDKAFNKGEIDNKSQNTTNIYVSGDVNNSNFSTGDFPNQKSSNYTTGDKKKTFFEKYWFPLLLTIISAAAVIYYQNYALLFCNVL